jgi:hypothetical protein
VKLALLQHFEDEGRHRLHLRNCRVLSPDVDARTRPLAEVTQV